MAPALSVCAIWEEIERSESYLVCSMFEEAASTSSSVLKCLYDTDFTDSIEEFQLDDVVESAGMVLVQSLKELGRTSEMLKELKLFFSSVAAIPVQVVLTGACFQISEGSVSGLKEFLEEFLGKWRYVNGEYYVLSSIDQSGANLERCQHRVLRVEQYLELVEVYAMTLLGTVLNDMGLAISWVEKAELPEGKKQVIYPEFCFGLMIYKFYLDKLAD
uniref:Protein APEM9-like n=1 Tax=Nelumbo nucifera TaxID=4432 RepID=A0A822ZN84_NELNU|nr:TPA_asm: hypothetical protein HUJ06_004463 [Nelumbo nucifera]